MGGGCLGTPEILREPYGGEFSFPFTGPVLAPCNLMGEGVPGNREKLPSSGATVGTPGSPVSHRSSLLSPVVPLSSFLFSLPILPLGLHYLLPTELLPDLSPVSASSMLCLWVLPPSFLSPVTVSATLGLPSPPRFPHPPPPSRPNPSHFLLCFKREKYSCFSNQLWAACGTNVIVYLSALDPAQASVPGDSPGGFLA